MPARAAKVLIVDDEPHIRTLLRATLNRAGYSVIEASNGREALNAKSIDKPDLILLDLGLPDRDGLELVTALRQEPRSALIVVSARDETEQKVAALDLGADDYVTKPFDTEELLDAVGVIVPSWATKTTSRSGRAARSERPPPPSQPRRSCGPARHTHRSPSRRPTAAVQTR